MSEMANSGMHDYWNGDGGHMWVNFQDRIDASLIQFGQEAISAATIASGDRVLDIGCGCGDTSIAIANLVGPDGHVHGIDISKPILAQARHRAASATTSNVTFECADAQSHRFESMSFDVVFSRFGVMFFDDPVAAFANIRQALKPGGRMAFICWQPVKDNEWVNLPLELVAKHIALPPPSGPEEPGGFSFGDANRVNRILAAAGFAGTSMQQFHSFFNVGSDLDEAMNFLTRIGPAGTAIEAADVNDITRARITTKLRATLAPCEMEHGVLLGAAAWIVTARNP